ncbi:cutinase-domain-containing protein [Bisporella sp. PMI_857]|nr:cutinase-domain-containing protein [Bisporella sp. PMI_857]
MLLQKGYIAIGLPGIGGTVDAISGALTTFEAGLATAGNVQTTQNGLASGACTAMTVIFARGTTEPGNVGVLTGPPFFDALTAMLGADAVTVQGVDYPADVEGFLRGGDATGSQTLATLIQDTMTKCPSTKIVMSGYSQGGQLVHNAAKLLPASTMAAVSSVVIFGDPNDGEEVSGAASKTLVICHAGDNICDHGDLILIPHLTYSLDAKQAATFAASQAGTAIGNA